MNLFFHNLSQFSVLSSTAVFQVLNIKETRKTGVELISAVGEGKGSL